MFDLISELAEELFSGGFRSTRFVYGRPDLIDLGTTTTAEEIILRIEDDIANRNINNDIVITGNLVLKYHKEIRAHWPEQSVIIFTRKSDNTHGIEGGLSLLESHTTYNREVYTEWMSTQLDYLNSSVEEFGVTWTNVEVTNMFTVDHSTLTESDNMPTNLLTVNEYTGPKSDDCVLRQIAIY
jgi:hypothetical protein